MRWTAAILAALLCAAPALTQAQGFTCPQIVETALAATAEFCAGVGRNQACYGNVKLDAELRPAAADTRFQVVGDLVNIAHLETLRLSPMDVTVGEWGVAVMKLQANLPDTLPGQNVTFLLFGDVEIQNAVTAQDAALRPMQAFILRTGAKDAACDEAPESGLLVQTPAGAGQIALSVNGVEVQMGSTVFFQAGGEDGLAISTLEGVAQAAVQGESRIIVPGTWISIPIGADLRPAGPPGLPRSYARRAQMLNALPLRLLERKIEVAPPLTPEQLERLLARLAAGEPPCGDDLLPCDRLEELRGDTCILCPLAYPTPTPRRPAPPQIQPTPTLPPPPPPLAAGGGDNSSSDDRNDDDGDDSDDN